MQATQMRSISSTTTHTAEATHESDVKRSTQDETQKPLKIKSRQQTECGYCGREPPSQKCLARGKRNHLLSACAHGVNSKAIIIRLYSRMRLEYNHFFAPTSNRMSL